MTFRIAPPWWPVLAAASPVLAPVLALRYRRHRRERDRVEQTNRERIQLARPLELPALERLELTVLVEERCEPGFVGDAGVSYLLRSDRGSLLLDVGFGEERPALTHNAARLGLTLADADALCISHLHLDHMGGMKAQRAREVRLPDALGAPDGKPCFLPDRAEAPGFTADLVTGPRMLGAGLATTGPLARSLFVMGWTEEQALVANLEGKGLVVLTGCGHPTVELILDMVRHLSDLPLYALIGGLHFPLTASRGARAGIQLQMVLGTGKPPWERLTEDDLNRAVVAIEAEKPERVLLSAHDSCDHALELLGNRLSARVEVLSAGATYQL